MNFIDKIKSLNKDKLPRPKVDKNRKIFTEKNQPLADFFAAQLAQAAGKTYICNSEQDLQKRLKELIKQKDWTNIYLGDSKLDNVISGTGISLTKDLMNIDAGINSCEYLVAETGSVVVSAAQEAGRRLNVYSPALIIIARKEQLTGSISEALDKILAKGLKPSQISLITGPSKTADIEKTLIHGMHGPKEIHVFIY